MNLDEIFRGSPTRSAWEALGRYLRAQKITGGHGIRVQQDSEAGTLISARRDRSANLSAASVEHPFQVIDASTEADGLRVYVRSGLVTSGWYDETSGWSGPPSNMQLDDSNEEDRLYLSATTSGYVLLKTTIATGNDPFLSDVTVEYQTEFPASTADTAWVILAVVTVTDGAISQIFQNVKSNLIHAIYFVSYSYPDRWAQMIGPMSPSM